VTTHFISDLHLEDDRPEIGRQFVTFLEGEARTAEALYILGDLFEYWVGDDDPNPHYARMKQAMRDFADTGVPLFFMHGNRDFLVGEQFAAETGSILLRDPEPVELYGTRVLLSHGDALCTDDTHYQQMRQMTRDPEWQAMMLAKPLGERVAIAEQARQQSQDYNAAIDEEIMDVNGEAVVDTIREHDVEVLLHGHTHRPAVHEIDLEDRTAQRIVLGDWYEHGSVVRWDDDGPRLEVMPR